MTGWSGSPCLVLSGVQVRGQAELGDQQHPIGAGDRELRGVVHILRHVAAPGKSPLEPTHGVVAGNAQGLHAGNGDGQLGCD